MITQGNATHYASLTDFFDQLFETRVQSAVIINLTAFFVQKWSFKVSSV